MITCAPFTKSPNCASQSTSASGAWTEERGKNRSDPRAARSKGSEGSLALAGLAALGVARFGSIATKATSHAFARAASTTLPAAVNVTNSTAIPSGASH